MIEVGVSATVTHYGVCACNGRKRNKCVKSECYYREINCMNAVCLVERNEFS